MERLTPAMLHVTSNGFLTDRIHLRKLFENALDFREERCPRILYHESHMTQRALQVKVTV